MKEGRISISICQANCLFHYTVLTPRSSNYSAEFIVQNEIHSIWKGNAINFDMYWHCGMEKMHVSQIVCTYSIQTVLTRLGRMKATHKSYSTLHKNSFWFPRKSNSSPRYFSWLRFSLSSWILAWHLRQRRQLFCLGNTSSPSLPTSRQFCGKASGSCCTNAQLGAYSAGISFKEEDIDSATLNVQFNTRASIKQPLYVVQ